jgi:predicted nucleic acid-binding protein
MAILDASFAVATELASDANHGAARQWLAGLAGAPTPLRAPAVMLAELAAAVRRRTGREDLAREALSAILAMPRLEIVPLTAGRARQAAEIATELGLRGCDAIYVALAAELREVLVTFDEEQAVRGGQRVQVVRPS